MSATSTAPGEDKRKLRRFRGEVLDVPAVAERLGVTQKLVRARIARGLLPHRRYSGRIVVLAAELERFLAALPGVSAEQALVNVSARTEAAR